LSVHWHSSTHTYISDVAPNTPTR